MSTSQERLPELDSEPQYHGECMRVHVRCEEEMVVEEDRVVCSKIRKIRDLVTSLVDTLAALSALRPSPFPLSYLLATFSHRIP